LVFKTRIISGLIYYIWDSETSWIKSRTIFLIKFLQQNITGKEWHNITRGTDQCKRYNSSENCDKWEYDHSFYKSTIISEVIKLNRFKVYNPIVHFLSGISFVSANRLLH
jgi:hypothetical protein